MPDAGLEPILTRAQQRVFSAWSPARAALAVVVSFLVCLLCSSMFLALFNVCCPEPELCLLMCCSGPSFYPFEDFASEHRVLCR
jgi:Na+/proline symporter